MAANGQRGEFDLSFGGRLYTFKLGSAAIEWVQEFLAVNGEVPTIRDIDLDIKRGRLKAIRGVLYAGLRKYHADKTLEDVADMIDAAEPDEVQGLLGRLMGSNVPDPKDLEALARGGDGRPTAADPGTGRQGRKRAARTGGVTSTSTRGGLA